MAKLVKVTAQRLNRFRREGYRTGCLICGSEFKPGDRALLKNNHVRNKGGLNGRKNGKVKVGLYCPGCFYTEAIKD